MLRDLGIGGILCSGIQGSVRFSAQGSQGLVRFYTQGLLKF